MIILYGFIYLLAIALACLITKDWASYPAVVMAILCFSTVLQFLKKKDKL